MSKIARSIQFDEMLLKKTDQISKKIKVSRNKIINDALRLWIKEVEKSLLTTSLKNASHEIQQTESLDNLWDSSLVDGLRK